MVSKNRWQLFIEYAKQHPKEIPTNTKKRAEIYRKLIDECKCGQTNKLCSVLQVPSVVQNKAMIEAKIKVYKEIIDARDQEIQELTFIINKLGKNRLGKPGTY